MALFGNKQEKTYDTGDLKVPVSLGVIMDGNGPPTDIFRDLPATRLARRTLRNSAATA